QRVTIVVDEPRYLDGGSAPRLLRIERVLVHFATEPPGSDDVQAQRHCGHIIPDEARATLRRMRRSLLQRAVKRVLDATGASTLLLLTAQVMAVTAGAVAVGLGRPVFFRQIRPGRDGKPFTMIKF